MNILYIVGKLPTNEKPWVQPFVKTQIDSMRIVEVNYEVIDLAKSFGDNWRKYLKGIALLRKLINKNHYDIIHAHYSFCGIVGRFQTKIPLVVSLMGSDLGPIPIENGQSFIRNRLERLSGKFIAYFSDLIIVKSQEMAEMLPKGKNIEVIPNGIDFKHFIPIEINHARMKFDLPKKKKIVLFACNPNSVRKNITLAKEAVKVYKKLYSDEIYFWNAWEIDHKDMPYVLSAADVLIFTSLFEGSPNLIKEAMACNLPIVSVPVGDVSKIISGSKNCFLTNYDPIDIAEKLKCVFESEGRSNGRNMIRHLSNKTIALKLKAFYELIIAGNKKL